jgi:hypothetical protein
VKIAGFIIIDLSGRLPRNACMPTMTKRKIMTRTLTKPAALLLAILLMAAPAAAFERVTEQREFTQLMQNSLKRFGIQLQVSADGRITGRGFGYPVTGDWQWQNGLFCRTLDWGGMDLGYNCQAVLRDGNRVRFVSDRGTGQHADFRLE